MSLRQFSEKTGITLVTACRYVHSQRTPRATEILKAAKALGTTCDYMLGLSDDPHKTRDGWTTHTIASNTLKSLDCVDRQAAIDICNNAIDLWHGQLGEGIVIAVKKKIEELPSAQPEMIREIRKWINSGNRGSADYFIVEKIEELINKYE